MGECSAEIKEIRFIIDLDLTHCYVLVNAIGDCPIGVQGWHYQAFPAKKPVDYIIQHNLKNYLSWSMKAPERQ